MNNQQTNLRAKSKRGCHTLILKFDKPFYFAGDRIQGTLEHHVSKTTKSHPITVDLKAYELVNWTESHGQYTKTYYSKKEFLREKKSFQYDQDELKPGIYKHSIDFQLPKNIPPSYHFATHRIKYRCKATLELPSVLNFMGRIDAFHLTCRAELKIYSMPLFDLLDKYKGWNDRLLTQKNIRGTKVEMVTTCDKKVYFVGDVVKIAIELHNCNNLSLIKHIRVKLKTDIKVKKYDKSEKHITGTKLYHCNIKKTEYPTYNKEPLEIGFQIPEDIPTNISHSKLFENQYWVAVYIDFPFQHLKNKHQIFISSHSK